MNGWHKTGDGTTRKEVGGIYAEVIDFGPPASGWQRWQYRVIDKATVAKGWARTKAGAQNKADHEIKQRTSQATA